MQVFKNDAIMEKSMDVTMDGIALYPGEVAEEGWYILSLDTSKVIKRSNFEVCPKYSERAIEYLVELAAEDYRKSERVLRHERDVDRIQDNTPRAVQEVIADPVQIDDGDDITLGALLTEDVKIDGSLPVDNMGCMEEVLTAIYQEAEADALVFLAQYSLQKGISMYGEAAIEAVKEELVGILEKRVGEITSWTNGDQTL